MGTTNGTTGQRRCLAARPSRTYPYSSERIRYNLRMTTIKADEVRIPRRAREAVALHEKVIVMNRERPAFVILHPDDHEQASRPRRGRPLRDALARLAQAAPPDADFGVDMESVLRDVGPAPADPWELS